MNKHPGAYTYVALGAGVYLPHAEGRIAGRPGSGDYQNAGSGIQALAGLRHRASAPWSLLLELKYDRGDLDIDMDRGVRARIDVSTFHAVAGASVDF